MSWWTNERKQYAAQYLMRAAGLSALGAAGLVSRWANVEASGGPTSINPSSGAFGIGQWLGNRKAGIYPNTNFDAQLSYAASELNGSEARAGNVLRNALTIDDAARGASMYERAEGYNAATGRDNWTGATASGVASIYALLGGQQTSQTTAQAQPGGSDGGDYADSAIATPGNLNTQTLIGAGIGLTLLWLAFRG